MLCIVITTYVYILVEDEIYRYRSASAFCLSFPPLLRHLAVSFLRGFGFCNIEEERDFHFRFSCPFSLSDYRAS